MKKNQDGIEEVVEEKKNVPDAIKKCLEAAEKGDPEAQYQVALYHEGIAQDVPLVLFQYVKAEKARYGRDVFYFENDEKIIVQDIDLAMKFYRKAAEQGHAPSQYRLAILLNVEAADWYRKAATQGHRGAMKSLGGCLFNGFGVVRDEGQALSWWNEAEEVGAVESGILRNDDMMMHSRAYKAMQQKG
jgi:TPR repeat protein